MRTTLAPSRASHVAAAPPSPPPAPVTSADNPVSTPTGQGLPDEGADLRSDGYRGDARSNTRRGAHAFSLSFPFPGDEMQRTENGSFKQVVRPGALVPSVRLSSRISTPENSQQPVDRHRGDSERARRRRDHD